MTFKLAPYSSKGTSSSSIGSSGSSEPGGATSVGSGPGMGVGPCTHRSASEQAHICPRCSSVKRATYIVSRASPAAESTAALPPRIAITHASESVTLSAGPAAVTPSEVSDVVAAALRLGEGGQDRSGQKDDGGDLHFGFSMRMMEVCGLLSVMSKERC
jgi:hypothetical protein